jgi:hypothetical protein
VTPEWILIPPEGTAAQAHFAVRAE